MPILLEEDLRRPLPKMYRVRQQFDETCLTDIEGTVRRELAKPKICALVKPGMRVAVGVGSRGIQNLSRQAMMCMTSTRSITPSTTSALLPCPTSTWM